MIRASFFDARTDGDKEDALIFTEHLDVPPRVGDFVTYSFEPTDTEKWDPQALAERYRANSLVNKWRVMSIHHSIRRLAVVCSTHQTICVMIAPVEDEQPTIKT